MLTRDRGLQVLDVLRGDLEVVQHWEELLFQFVVGAHDCAVHRLGVQLVVGFLFFACRHNF